MLKMLLLSILLGLLVQESSGECDCTGLGSLLASLKVKGTPINVELKKDQPVFEELTKLLNVALQVDYLNLYINNYEISNGKFFINTTMNGSLKSIDGKVKMSGEFHHGLSITILQDCNLATPVVEDDGRGRLDAESTILVPVKIGFGDKDILSALSKALLTPIGNAINGYLKGCTPIVP